jgi:hypothetical protein
VERSVWYSGACGESATAGEFSDEVHFCWVQELWDVEESDEPGIEFGEAVDEIGSVACEDIGGWEDFAGCDSENLSDRVNGATDHTRAHIDNDGACF